MQQVLSAIIEHGGLAGAILVGCAGLLIRLQRQLSEVQEKRVSDAKAVASQILALVESNHEVSKRLATVLEANTVALRELREDVRRPRPAGG